MNTVQSTADFDLFLQPERFGIAPSALVRLDRAPHYSQVAYMDLVENGVPGLGAIEDQGNPVLYLLSCPPVATASASESLQSLIQKLACRGDAHYLAEVRPGRLDIYPIQLEINAQPRPVHAIDLQLNPSGLHEFLTGVATLPTSHKGTQKQVDAKWLDRFLFRLLKETARQLKETQTLTDSQVLSLVGRGLFMRFIADRKIIQAADASTIANDKHVQTTLALFDTSHALAHSCEWLDRTFNGNLLPLFEHVDGYPGASEYLKFFTGGREAVCRILANILHSAPAGQLQLGWHSIQFQHVPADMLSQVYEHFAHEYQKKQAKQDSVHYTPRHIAQQLVNAAFAGTSLQDKSQAHVLDPTVGAGVFLVLAFKRLVQERWKTTGKRPNRQVIRKILQEQLCGLDVNAESLKFAALSLYLTALELDPHPAPLSDLRFEPLDGSVLRSVGRFKPLGSLHQDAALDLGGRFDMVMGNPPWTKPKGQKALIKDYTRVVQQCAATAGISPPLVSRLRAEQGNPDPVFVWRSLAWAKPGGTLAFALHAQHMLFQKGDSFTLRQALLQCVEVTGVLNGSSLHGTSIWPNHSAPFCLWVAKNQKPTAHSAFYYVKPYLEKCLVAREQYRMDPQDAIVVSQTVAAQEPALFKALHRGEGLAWRVLEQVVRVCTVDGVVKTLVDNWKELNLKSGNGFQTASGKSDASSLVGFRKLEKVNLTNDASSHAFSIDPTALEYFDYDVLHRVRETGIYRAPLVLFPQSPAIAKHARGARVAWSDIAYSESFNGYSCGTDDAAPRRARYLQLLSCSDVFWFVMLLTSSKFGVERPVLQKDDIDAMPFIPWEKLPQEQHLAIDAMSQSLHAGEDIWDAINLWAQKLYKLTNADAQVMQDTLAVGLPFSVNEKWAHAAPSQSGLNDFANAAQRIISPFSKLANVVVQVDVVPAKLSAAKGWRFARVTFGATQKDIDEVPPRTWVESLALADKFWASQVQIHGDNGALWFGQLAQNRYWTKTRARIFALEVLQTELAKYAGRADSASNHGTH